ncbi:MAG TPA: hypothetical protein DEP00_03995 [Lachnospiraceae bacterium]|nr:hypothetical protein [Lachnospiraceae bacterium]
MSDDQKNDAVNISLEQIDGFRDNPFPVEDDDEFRELTEDIRVNGLADPITVFPKKDGRYQLVSGHRRKLAFEKLGETAIPCHVIEPLSDAQLRLMVVQFNENRKTIKPTTRIRAAEMKYEALKKLHKGASVEELYALASNDAGTSRTSFLRLRRLAKLPEETLKMMDEGRISIHTADILAGMDEKTFDTLIKLLKKDPSIGINERKAVRISRLENPRADRIRKILTDDRAAGKSVLTKGGTGRRSLSAAGSWDEYIRIAEAALKELHPEMKNEKDKTAETSELLLWAARLIKRAQTSGEFGGRPEGEIMAAIERKVFDQSPADQFASEFSEDEDLEDDLDIFSENSGPKPLDDTDIDFDERPDKDEIAYKPIMPD